MPNEVDWICEIEEQLITIERYGAANPIPLEMIQRMVKETGGCLDVKQGDNMDTILYYITLLFIHNRYFDNEDYQHE